TIYFHSQLVLFPEYNMGYFVSMNTGGVRTDLRKHLLESFLERFFPHPQPPEPESLADFRQRAKELVGSYLFSRAVFTKFYKAMSIFSQVSVSVMPQNRLFVTLPSGLGSRQWIEIEPYLFKEVGGSGRLLFGKDEKGQVRYLYFNEYPFMIGLKARWFENKNFVFITVLICSLLLLSFLIWPLSSLWRRLCRRPKVEMKRKPVAKWVLGLAATLQLVFLLALIGLISNEASLLYGVTPIFKLLFALPVASIVFLFMAFIFCLVLWWRKCYTGCSRLHYSLILMAGIVMLWIFSIWNLLGWKF
ncbi:MAG: hypothetical protein N3B16_07150, partial [Candidatus Aminicenantes bacterium]|nr:hypothetical protein [Candidatus Aminicenantes bacterium]